LLLDSKTNLRIRTNEQAAYAHRTTLQKEGLFAPSREKIVDRGRFEEVRACWEGTQVATDPVYMEKSPAREPILAHEEPVSRTRKEVPRSVLDVLKKKGNSRQTSEHDSRARERAGEGG